MSINIDDNIGNSLSFGTYFMIYEYFKSLLYPVDDIYLKYIYSSGISSFLTSLFLNPYWQIKQKEKKIKDSKHNFAKQILYIIRKKGFLDLFKGIDINVVLVIQPIIQFLLYETLKRKLKNQVFLKYFFVAAFSRAIANIIIYPYYIIRKTANQIQVNSYKQIKQNYFQIITNIYQTKGLSGFYKDFLNRFLKSILFSSILLTIYEKQVQILQFYFVNN